MANGVKGVLKSSARRFGWRHLLVGLWLAACGGALGSRTAGGESHFLRQCEDECGSGLECVSGVCTRGCLVGEDKCTDLAAGAVCTDASIEPGALAVCDLSCESDRGCAALGEAFTCEAGFCRGPLLPGQSSGGSSSGGSGATGGNAGSGTGAVSTGGQPGTGFYAVPECSGLARDIGFEERGGTPCPDGMSCVLDYEPPGMVAPGICVGAGAVGACASDGECPEGFGCTAEGDCSPTQVNCWAPWTCEVADPPPCSYGYAHSRVGIVDGVASCLGPCVPITRCGCSNDDECPPGAVCDTELGQCQQPLPWQPPNECALPFEVGPCDAAMRVFAFVDGACQEQTYGGCEGNANRFATLEECMAVCEGRPIPNPCPEGREQHITCIECLPADGCGEWATVCAEPCTTDDDCTTFGHICQNGACGMFCN